MAVLNVRVDDEIHDALKRLAELNGQSLSEFVRDRMLEIVHPVVNEVEHGDLPAPETLSVFQRQTLSLLHRILGRVLPEGDNDGDGDLGHQLEQALVVESGFTGEYWRTVAGFETELSLRDSRRVVDILQMFRIITFSIARLDKDGCPVDPSLAKSLEFRGFDHNDTLESHMARYVRFQMREHGRWNELRPQVEKHDHGNSHMKILEVYLRMLTEFRRIMRSRERDYSSDAHLLTIDELQRLRDARTHPDHR